MKDYNFILYHKTIDSICDAWRHIDKAKMQLLGAVYEADYSLAEDDTLHEIRFKMGEIKDDLDEIKKKLISMDTMELA